MSQAQSVSKANPIAVALTAAIAAKVTKAIAKGPMYDLGQLRVGAVKFRKAVATRVDVYKAERVALAAAADAKGKKRRDLIDKALPLLEDLLRRQEAACDRLEQSVLVHDSSVTSQQVFTPEQKQLGNAGGDSLVRFRSAISDVTLEGDDEAKALREDAHIGDPIPRANPMEMKDALAVVLRLLNGPPAAEVGTETDAARLKTESFKAQCDERGVILEAFEPDLAERHAELSIALDKQPTGSKSDARRLRDLAQLEVEEINARILVSENALGGQAARDLLRDKLPKTTQGQRQSDRAPAAPGEKPEEGTPGETPEAPPTPT